MNKSQLPAFLRVFLFAFGLVSGLFGLSSPALLAADANYDEENVPAYTLPEALTLANGRPVEDAKTWRGKRRPELLALFESDMYGRAPARPTVLEFDVTSVDGAALGGKATRKEVRIRISRKPEVPALHLLLFLPNQVAGPAPAFLGLNFGGNQTIHADPGISISKSWMRANPGRGVTNHQATAASRGTAASRWPIETILERGYALATVYYGDIEPDHPEGWKNGVRAYFGATAGRETAPPDAWGAIGAWAWGLSRVMDYFEKDRAIDVQRVIVLGHSRLGKTALWAGATDPRFAAVISNDSGCGGAALSRREFGETVQRINTAFPHWFCARFKEYNERVAELPFDQHELIALIAPRPVYVASAEEDRWADPKGEFLAAKHAELVYALFGLAGLGVDEMPEVNQPVGDIIRYHIRSGPHDVTAYDWDQYLEFADRHLQAAP